MYQAYRPAIASFALKHQRFGGPFSFNRMSWIKPNFLWMMYRSGWASQEGQERILAIRLSRAFFEELLAAAVPSSFHPACFATVEAWQTRVADSEVRLKWDPDHDPLGVPQARRALQLGLRGQALRRCGESELVAVVDVTPLVLEQKKHICGSFENLLLPRERVFVPNQAASSAIGLDSLLVK